MKWNVLSKGDEETAAICISLGKLLETGINEDSDLIHLKMERELTEAYVAIQSFRYDQSFEICWECDERLTYALVPKLSLQPLVENAIFHGLSKKKKEGMIWIRAYAEEKRCYLEIEDNGAGWKPASPQNAGRKRKGIGLKNVRERLELLFKQDASLEIEQTHEGTRVRLGFPLLLAKPYTEGGPSDVERTAR
ncbi:Sensor histidine kinase YehU [compost metagenome]